MSATSLHAEDFDPSETPVPIYFPPGSKRERAFAPSFIGVDYSEAPCGTGAGNQQRSEAAWRGIKRENPIKMRALKKGGTRSAASSPTER